MKRTLAFLCVLALVLSLVPATAFAATQDVQAELNAGAETIVLEADASNITVTRDTIIDLNGHDLDGVSVLGGTLYLRDSETADYTVADGVYGQVTNVTGNVKAAEGYLQVGDSFHAVNLDIYAMTLRASDVGVYYKSNFAADEIVAAEVESFGVALSVVTAPNASNLETYCGYSQFTGFEAGEGANSVGTSTLLKNIMKAANGDSKNAKNAAMPVYGSAYIKTSEGYYFGETVKRSLQEQVEAIDGVWGKLSDAQKSPVLAMLESYTAVMEGWNIPNIRGIQVPGADADIEIPIEVTAENGIVTEAVTVEANGVCVTVPAGTKLAEGVETLNLTVTPVEAEDTGLTLKEDRVLIPMDVHVEGLAADNAQPLTIYLGKIMPENLNMGNYTVYHVENGKAGEMTLIPVDAEFTAHNQYKYTLDGELTLYMASFSVIAAEVNEENAWKGERDYSWYNTTDKVLYIRNADQLAGFGAIVGGMAKDKDGNYLITYNDSDGDVHHNDTFDGKTVVLWADINLGDDEKNNVESKIFYPIGYWNSDGTYEKTNTAISSGFYAFEGVFDGNGNTVSNFYQNTWEMKGDHDWYDAKLQYFRDGMGLFGKVYGGTVKNLIVDNFSCDSEIGTTGVIAAYADSKNGQPAIFENITITNCNPRVYNIGNGGIVGCAGWYSRNEDLKLTVDDDEYANAVTFRNITVDQTNKISALWGSWGVSCAGILGQYYPNSACGIKLENCHVAAIIDVNNDVCSNYQYYWYRYAGMFIGTIRANTKDANGYEIADTTGVTATDCTYTMGNWNEYWYCEIVANSIASYTHDHQFSRLDNITSLSEIQDENGKWDKEGHFALLSADRKSVECYHIFKDSNGNLYQHFHDQGDETNGFEPYETVDVDGDGTKETVLKEDRQRYFIPFNQLFTGLDMGIKAHTEFKGIRFVEDGKVKSEVKFEKLETANTTYKAGQTISLGELVKAIVDESKIAKATLYAAVSPANEDTTTKASAIYALDAGDWKNSSITLGENCVGAIKIVITDYFYCTPTVIILNPEVAAPKFEAKTVAARSAYTRITLGDLFTAVNGATIGDVTATVTAPGGIETTVPGTSSNWTTKTIDLTKNGEWTVVIKDDDEYCSVTTATFTVNKVDKFSKKFDKDFLYRVGNVNSVGIGYIFGENKVDYTLNLSSVNVEIENVEGNANGTFTADQTTWTSGTISFTGTGVVKLTISADGANAFELPLEVVDAYNVTMAGGDYQLGGKRNSVLLENYTMPENGNIWLENMTLYGNGFKYNVVAGRDGNTTSGYLGGNYAVALKNAILDNVQIIGEVYTKYGAQAKSEYNYPVVLTNGNSIIANSYISNGASPVRAQDGNLQIINSTLEGGIFANLDIRGGEITLDNVITINQSTADGSSTSNDKKIVGLGIVFYECNVNAKLHVKTGADGKPLLKQYNCISKNTEFKDTTADSLKSAMFQATHKELQYTDSNGTVWVNPCILSATEGIGSDNIDTMEGYSGKEATIVGKTGYVYTVVPNADSINSENVPEYEAKEQYYILPAGTPDHNAAQNYVAPTTASNEFCYYNADIKELMISFDEGKSKVYDPNILEVTKAGQILAYTVKIDGVDYTGKTITFNQSGTHTIVYSYTDPYNFRLNEQGDVVSVEVTYEQIVRVTVAAVKPTAKDAKFTFYGYSAISKTAATTITDVKTEKSSSGNIYIMPSSTGTYVTSKTIDGITVNCPRVYVDFKDNTSDFNWLYPVFLGVKIEDYADGGTAETATTIVSPTSTSKPNNLTILTVDKPAGGGGWSSGSGKSGSEGKIGSGTYKNLYGWTSGALGSDQPANSIYCQFTYKDNKNTTYYYVIEFYRAAHKCPSSCVTSDTLITLADGTQKRVDELSSDDKILAWDFFAGTYVEKNISLLVNHGEAINKIVNLTFSDSTQLRIVGEHGVFDYDLNKFVYITVDNMKDYIGHRFVQYNADGSYNIVTLTDAFETEEYTSAWSITSAGTSNAFASGLLTVAPPEDFYNWIEMDGKLHYDVEQFQKDVETYGLYTYDVFADYVTYEQFVDWNGTYLKIAVEKGYFTFEYILELIELYKGWMPQ